MGQVLPEDQALLFHQHLPGQREKEREREWKREKEEQSEREREREGAVLVCERDLIKGGICQSNVNLKVPSFTVALSGRLPLSPKMTGERNDARDFNLSSRFRLGRCSARSC